MNCKLLDSSKLTYRHDCKDNGEYDGPNDVFHVEELNVLYFAGRILYQWKLRAVSTEMGE